MQTLKDQKQLISTKELTRFLSMSKSTIQRRVNEGLFPPPINSGLSNRNYYLYDELNEVLNAFMRGENNDSIKLLVADMVKNRGERKDVWLYE